MYQSIRKVYNPHVNKCFNNKSHIHWLCRYNTVAKVENFVLKDVIFQGADRKGTPVIVLMKEVVNAIIVKNSFLSNNVTVLLQIMIQALTICT